MKKIEAILEGKETIGIAGHVRPDGDCVGSCLALYQYICQEFPKKKVTVYLERVPEVFSYLPNADKVVTKCTTQETYDLFIALDSSDLERLGEAGKYFEQAKTTVCIDHHVTNLNYAMENIVENVSSTCEVLYEMFAKEKVTKSIAECLYTGIVHDSGVFKYSNTSPRTLEIAGNLIRTGIDFSRIIDETFYMRTYVQNQILGRALLESVLFLDGQCIFSVVSQQTMKFYEIQSEDVHGIVEQLRNTKGVECAIFLNEIRPMEYKVSMRSNDKVDVSKVALKFGGGGHKKAAGCTMSGTIHDVINNLSIHIEQQLLS